MKEYTRTNKFKVVGGRNEYGGQVIQVEFDEEPSDADIRAAAYSFDTCPFGIGIKGKSGNVVSIKIYND